MQWSIAAVYRLLGIDEIAITRICLFLIGLVAAGGMYRLLYLLFHDLKIAFAGAWLFNFSPLFYYYTMNPLPDLFGLAASIWTLAFFTNYIQAKEQKIWLYLSAFALLLASLGKIHFIIFGGAMALYIVGSFFRAKDWAEKKQYIEEGLVFLIFQIPAVIWYKWVMWRWESTGITTGGIFDKDMVFTKEKYMQILHFHATDLLPNILLGWVALPFFILCIVYIFIKKAYKGQMFGYWIATGVMVFLAFIYNLNVIEFVHDYYMIPFLVPLYVMVTWGLRVCYQEFRLLRPFVYLALVLAPIYAYSKVQNYWSVEKSYFNADIMNNKAELRAAAPQNALCIMLNDISGYMFAYAIDKQGFVFSQNIPISWVEDMVNNKNATYLYFDNRELDENPELLPFIEKKILEKGTLRVFKLKRTK